MKAYLDLLEYIIKNGEKKEVRKSKEETRIDTFFAKVFLDLSFFIGKIIFDFHWFSKFSSSSWQLMLKIKYLK